MMNVEMQSTGPLTCLREGQTMMSSTERRMRMGKVIDMGRLPKDDPIFSAPLFFAPVRKPSELAELRRRCLAEENAEALPHTGSQTVQASIENESHESSDGLDSSEDSVIDRG